MLLMKSKKIIFALSIVIGLVVVLVYSLGKKEKIKRNDTYTQYVDPLIGSGGHGHVFVGANVPFGFVQLGPTQLDGGWDWCSGYNYSSNVIAGFTHTHLSGTGCADLNDILLLPFTGKTNLTQASYHDLKNPESATKEELENSYGSLFTHKNEVVKPGYYGVFLDRYKIKAELTASERVGFHKYSFKQNDQARILLDLSNGLGEDVSTACLIKKTGSKTLVGYRNSKGWAKDQRLFFAMEFSEVISGIALYDSIAMVKGFQSKGKKIKAVLDFKTKKGNQILVKVGLSPVSTENAIENIKAEIPDWDFHKIVDKADKKWNTELSKIVVDADTKKVFYTSLYHTMIAPSIYNDVNGDYQGADKKTHKATGFTNYTTFSLWDTYRALHLLYTIIQEDKINDIIQSFLAIYDQQGRLPVWHLMSNETDCMVGNHSIPVIVDAYFKGYRGYDVEHAFEAMKKTATSDRRGLDYLNKIQHIPAESINGSVAIALEYAIDDWCIAQMAKDMKKIDDYAYFTKRAELYKEYFDKTTGFMRGKKKDGKWTEPFNPLYSDYDKTDYVEGNAWQYAWLVPQDPMGLIALFGGDENFTTKLDALFDHKEKMAGPAIPIDISGLMGQYAHGNEPGHHIPYLYVYAGKQWKTAKRVRDILEQFYTAKPDGICGNEDVGQMSAWYVLSSMGFYAVNPANGIYVLGSPSVNEAVIHYKAGISFKMKAVNNSKTNVYIQKAEYNGKPYTKPYITHNMIVKGGELKLFMGNKPKIEFGKKEEDRPK